MWNHNLLFRYNILITNSITGSIRALTHKHDTKSRRATTHKYVTTPWLGALRNRITMRRRVVEIYVFDIATYHDAWQDFADTMPQFSRKMDRITLVLSSIKYSVGPYYTCFPPAVLSHSTGRFSIRSMSSVIFKYWNTNATSNMSSSWYSTTRRCRALHRVILRCRIENF